MKIEYIISIGSLTFAIFSWYVNFNKKEKLRDKEETTTFVSVKADVKYVSKQCSDIVNKIDRLESIVNNVNVGIAENKANIATLFKKYDELKEEIARLKK